MGDYDREMSRERGAMTSSGQGSAAGGGTTGGMIGGESGGSGGPMVTVPSMAGGQQGGSSSAGGGGGGGGAGRGSDNDIQANRGEAGGEPQPKFEIPEDIAEAKGSEDQVARQIREAAEGEEDPRIRKALWDEYRKHRGIKADDS